MNYREYRKQMQEEFDKLPIFWAITSQQLREALEARGYAYEDRDKVCIVSKNGAMCMKEDLQVVEDFLNKPDRLSELMEDYDFAVSAFEYEMDNHEYAINWQGDWDVVNCFVRCEYQEDYDYEDYLKEAGKEEWIKAYREAKKRHYKKAEEWF